MNKRQRKKRRKNLLFHPGMLKWERFLARHPEIDSVRATAELIERLTKGALDAKSNIRI